jgi:phosphoesterase RecJ-like protein
MWSEFVKIVHAHQRFVVTCHVRPDGDALGSSLAMALVLESLGKEVLLCVPFAVPPNHQFLDPRKRFKQLGVDVVAEELEVYDVLIVLDTSAFAQLGGMADVIRATRLKKVVIDHHISGDDLDAVLLKNADRDSTGHLVVEAADALGVAITPEIAVAVFVALATDTGWFRFSSTTGETYRLAGRLADAGAVPHDLYERLYENETLSRLRLIGRTMARTTTELAGRLIHTYIERVDFDAVGAHPADSEDIINMTLSVTGTEVAVILVEQRTGGFKISFRSRNDLDCAAVAAQFGGGGHRQAAGAFLNEPLEAARARVLDVVRAAMR